MIDYNNPPECIHGFIVGKTRTGQPACPFCRRVTRAPEKQPRRRVVQQPVLDVAMLAAGDDTLDDTTAAAPVINLSTARRRRREGERR